MRRYIIRSSTEMLYSQEMNMREKEGDKRYFAVPKNLYIVGDMVTFDYGIVFGDADEPDFQPITKTYVIDEILDAKTTGFFQLERYGLMGILGHYSDYTKLPQKELDVITIIGQ